MTTQQHNTAALTDEQLDAVAGGVKADENGRPCTDPRRHRRGILVPFPTFPSDPREMNDGVVRNRR